jgi:hypothetical protein
MKYTAISIGLSYGNNIITTRERNLTSRNYYKKIKLSTKRRRLYLYLKRRGLFKYTVQGCILQKERLFILFFFFGKSVFVVPIEVNTT